MKWPTRNIYVVAFQNGDIPDTFVIVAPNEREAFRIADQRIREMFPHRENLQYVLQDITITVIQYAREHLGCDEEGEIDAQA